MPPSERTAKAGPNGSPERHAIACVLHGAWLPEGRAGQFMVWGECARDRAKPGRNWHPFCSDRLALEAAVSELWSDLALAGPDTGGRKRPVWALLPSTSARPRPSLELQAELDAGEVPRNTFLEAWRVDAIGIDDCPGFLAALQGVPPSGIGQVQIGWDLRFWTRLTERLQGSVVRQEYLPSITPLKSTPKRSRARGGRGRKSARRPAAIQFKAGWELAEATETAMVERFAKAMPAACRALRQAPASKRPTDVPLPEPRSLIRSFLGCQLDSLVGRKPFPISAMRPVQGSFLAKALPSPRTVRASQSAYRDSPIDRNTWGQWKRWRDRIQRSGADSDETVCFRLTDATGSAPDRWRVEWLLSSRGDPSLIVPLADFWSRAEWARPSPRSVREVLIQLGQACRLCNRLWAGMDSDAPVGVELDREEALVFLREQAPILQGAGFRVIVPAWWTATGQRRLRLRLTTRGVAGEQQPGPDGPGFLGFDTLLEFDAEIVLDGKPLSREEWRRLVAAKEGLVQLRGQWMELRPDEIAQLEEHWNAAESTVTMSVAEYLRTESASGGIEVVHAGETGRLLASLRGANPIEMLEQPAGFVGQLRPYQLRGLSWLAYLERLGFGACLADDMGLGKTIQVIAGILYDAATSPAAGPTLLVAPTSVVGNWRRETGRFAPSLKAVIHHGPGRPRTPDGLREAIAGADMVVVSFGVARLDAKILRGVPWRRLVVDEAQNIKNPSAAVTKAIRGIKASRRVALTGTPVENRLTDLWSLFSVLNPGYLGTITAFRKTIERPIMRKGDEATAQRLRRMVRPFILRRMKTDKAIIKDLPEKVEQLAYCNLTPEQASLYAAVLKDLESRLDEKSGVERLGLVLSTLTRLKQICNHPAQFLQDGSDFTESRSHKLARTCAMLDEIEAEGESALVFTQFTEIGKSLEALFRKRYASAVYYLHGGTSRTRREHLVEEFQNPNSPAAIFVLSLKAGGTGLTLTRANHVIHFDRWWNPAVENQATDRAYRIGQSKRVLVHKMVTMGTLEERIDELIESKKRLADEIIGSDESWLSKLDNETFRGLIALDRASAVMK